MREPRMIEIDGCTYRVGQLPPRKALRLGNRLVRAAGPGLIALMSEAGEEKRLADVDLALLGTVIRSVLDLLTPDEQDGIMAELFSAVQVEFDGRLAPVMKVFDAHFIDRLPVALQLVWVALEENFASFGPALAGLVGKAGALRSKASTTSSTTGLSGG